MRKSLFIILFLVLNICHSQEKITIFFNDGTTKTGFYKINQNSFGVAIVNRETKERYTLKEISNVILFKDTIKFYFDVIDVKTNFDDKKTKKKFGLLAYASPKMKMYYVQVAVYSGGGLGMGSIADSNETYVKKNGDSIAYNLGYIYGAGPRGIKKRVRDYFIDCPELVELVDEDKINKHETLEMIYFYEKNCAK